MRDRKLKMNVDGSTDAMFDEPYTYTDPFHGNNFLRKVHELYLRSELCDIEIDVEGRSIFTHKMVLAANSPYFERMFSSDLIESRSEKISLKDISYNILKCLIDFCYTAAVEVNSENALSLLSGADMLQFEGIKQCCCAFLQTKLDAQNCLSLATFADIHTCHNLKETAEEFCRTHFREIMHHEEFCQIPYEQLKALLAGDFLSVITEKDVFESIILWVKYDEIQRKNCFYELFTEVRLANLSPKIIVECIEQHEMTSSDSRCLKLINDAKTYQLLPTYKEKLQVNIKPRLSKADFSLYLIGGETKNLVFDTMDCYSFAEGRWRPKPQMSAARDGLGVAMYDGNIYVAGGFDGQGALRSCEYFSPEKNMWCEISPMHHARHAFSICEHQGWIYAAGGSDFQNTEYNTVERYDPLRDSWEEITSMASKREGLVLIQNDNVLYAIGGENGQSILNTVERFDARTGQWYNCASMGYRRRYFGAAVINDKIYAIGGSDYEEDLNTAEIFEARVNRWIPIPSMSKRRESVAVVAVESRLYAIGGACMNKETDSIEVYDPNFNRWEDFCKIPRAKEGMGVVAI